MKLNATQTKKLTTIINKAKRAYKPETPPARNPVAQMIVSFLTWESKTDAAESAFGRMMAEVVDINELRVSSEADLRAWIGADYPMLEERVARMREALFAVFNREHAVEMRSVTSKGKKDQKQYLDTLPGMLPYVSAQTMLLAFGGHAVPVDSRLAGLIASELSLDEDEIDLVELESLLTRTIKAADGLESHLALQAWADKKGKSSLNAKPAAKKTPAKKTTKKPAASKTSKTTKKKVAKKTTKKKVAKKTTKKKTTTKKTTRKKTASRKKK